MQSSGTSRIGDLSQPEPGEPRFRRTSLYDRWSHAPPHQRREVRRIFLFFAAVLALVFIARVYRHVDEAAFVWDDHVLVEGNATYRHGSISQLLTESFWPESPLADARALSYYRPAVLLTYRFDLLLGGTAADFHVTNLLLHLAACAFLAIIAIRLGASYPRAVGAMLIWGVMPRLTEAVVWVAGRTDVLAAFFGLAALAVWPEMSIEKSRQPWRGAGFGAVLLFAALLSKEVAFSFVGVLLLASWLQKADKKRAALTIGGPVLAYLALRTIALAGRTGAHRPLGFWTRAGTALEASERYLEMTLDALRPRTSIGLVGDIDGVRAAIGAGVLVLALVVAYFVAKRAPFGVRIGLALSAIAIAPVLHVLPVGFAGSVACDRLLYVPLAGLAIAAATGVNRRVAFLAPLLAIVLGVATSKRVDDYREETAFWVTAAETSHPHNVMPRLALGGWISKAGDVEPACRVFERARELAVTPPQRGRASENLSSCWARLGRYDDAIRLAKEVVDENPSNARPRLILGYALLHVRAFDEATAYFDDAVRRDPSLAPYRPSPATLAHIRDQAIAFRDPYWREQDPDAWANHLAALGRAPEATEAFLALALDEWTPLAVREDATRYLLAYGEIEDTESVLEVIPKPDFGWDTGLLHTYASRRRVHRAVQELAPRIDALGH